MRRGLITVMVVAMAALQGCGETCQSTCDHVYAESECGVTKQGWKPGELIDYCVDQCDDALQIAGSMDDYEPYEHISSQDADGLQLANETQAAAWIDCVWDTAPDPGYQASCENLDPPGGICAPI